MANQALMDLLNEYEEKAAAEKESKKVETEEVENTENTLEALTATPEEASTEIIEEFVADNPTVESSAELECGSELKPQSTSESEVKIEVAEVESEIAPQPASQEKKKTVLKLNRRQKPAQDEQVMNDFDEFMKKAQEKQASVSSSHEEELPSFTPEPVPTIDDIIGQISSNKTVEEPQEYSMMELLERSGTYFSDDWITTYEKARKSNKDNLIQRKIKQGRFRYNKEHGLEFLPDVDTYGKTADEIMEEKWL